MNIKNLLACTALAAASAPALAADISVEITNLSHGSYFTPLFLSAHDSDNHVFRIGDIASDALQAMAEGGDISGLITDAESIAASTVANPAEGLLAPGASTEVLNWDTGDNSTLSLTAMILPSNDGFVGLDAWPIPTTAGTYTVYLNAYDAGTEANDEIVNGGGAVGTPGIPVDPGMRAGTGASGVATDISAENNNVHIHRGIVGDTSAEGGSSDLDSRVHRWLNPVAKLVISVQ